MKEKYSCGLICLNEQNKILLVRRKNSYAYTSLIRGNYQKENIINIINDMTREEAYALINTSFEQLWLSNNQTKYLQYCNNESTIKIMYQKSLKKYKEFIKLFPNFIYYISHNDKFISEPEWGFPKGTRKENETDIECAIREFVEETGIPEKNITILNETPLYEYYIGTDHKLYKYVFFVATLKNDVKIFNIDKNNMEQVHEISKIIWSSKNDLHKKIEMNIVRENLIEDAKNIFKSSLNQCQC